MYERSRGWGLSVKQVHLSETPPPPSYPTSTPTPQIILKGLFLLTPPTRPSTSHFLRLMKLGKTDCQCVWGQEPERRRERGNKLTGYGERERERRRRSSSECVTKDEESRTAARWQPAPEAKPQGPKVAHCGRTGVCVVLGPSTFSPLAPACSTTAWPSPQCSTGTHHGNTTLTKHPEKENSSPLVCLLSYVFPLLGYILCTLTSQKAFHIYYL